MASSPKSQLCVEQETIEKRAVRMKSSLARKTSVICRATGRRRDATHCQHAVSLTYLEWTARQPLALARTVWR